MAENRVAVIGAGISGLTTAYYLQKETGLSIDVFEKNHQVGGCIDTMRHDSYWQELGAHTCYNSYKELIGIIQDLGMEDEVVARGKASFRVLKNGKLHSIPSQISFLNLALNLPKAFLANKEGKTVKEFYSSIMGKKNYEQLMRHMFRAVICQDADDFPAEFFLKRRNGKVKSMPASFTFKKGLNSFLERIADLEKVTIKNELIFSLDKSSEGFVLKTEEGESYHYDYVILAMPPQTASKLLSDSFSSLSNELANYSQSRSKSFGVIVRKESVSWENTAVAVATEGDLMSVVSRDVLPDDTFRAFTFHAKKDKLLLEEAKVIIKEVLDITDEAIVKLEEKVQVLPKMDWRQKELVRSIQLELEGRSLGLVGNYFHGLSLEDCVQRAKEEALRLSKQIASST